MAQRTPFITYDPVVLPTEPGMERLMNNMVILHTEAGIVVPPPTPRLPDPVSNTLAAYQTSGLKTNLRSR